MAGVAESEKGMDDREARKAIGKLIRDALSNQLVEASLADRIADWVQDASSVPVVVHGRPSQQQGLQPQGGSGAADVGAEEQASKRRGANKVPKQAAQIKGDQLKKGVGAVAKAEGRKVPAWTQPPSGGVSAKLAKKDWQKLQHSWHATVLVQLGHCNIKKGTNDYNGLNDFAICTDCGANFVARWEGAKATFKHWSSSRLLTSTFQRAEGKGGGVCDPRIVNELICKLVDEDEEEGGQSV